MIFLAVFGVNKVPINLEYRKKPKNVKMPMLLKLAKTGDDELEARASSVAVKKNSTAL